MNNKWIHSRFFGCIGFALVTIVSTNQIARACEGATIFACKKAEDAQSIFDNAINPEIQEKNRQTLINSGSCKNICRENLKMSGSSGIFVIYEDGEKNKWFVR